MKNLFESMLFAAIEATASDIHIGKQANGIAIHFRTRGKLVPFKTLSFDEGEALINYIKYESNLDIDYRFTLKTGSFTYTLDERRYRFRVSSIPSINGDNLVIRLLDQVLFTSIEELTYDSNIHAVLNKIILLRQGLILISGPTGVGKSTTLHVLLKNLYEKTRGNIITIEDPIEMIVPEFIQIQISNRIDYDQALMQILRHDPDVIMIGELRDSYSANLAIRCALTGCLVMTTIHSMDCDSTLKRLANLEVNQVELQEVLQYIIAQKLIYSKHDITALFEYYDVQNKEKYTFLQCKENLIEREMIDEKDQYKEKNEF